jgi:hypothetical protein
MGKIVFWLVLIFAVLLVLRIINTSKSRARRGPARSSAKPGRQDAMVRCVGCGVYLPSAEAKTGPDGPLCGDPQCVRTRARRED